MEVCVKSLIFGILIALTLAAAAQAQQTAPKEHSMTGCLQKAPDDMYILTDVEGKGPKTVGIISSTPNLAPHVGHKIEVTGTAVPAAEAEKENAPKAPHYMRLTAIKMISTSCP